MSKSLHPDIKKFKAFVKNQPHVLRDVKSGDKNLQDLYEEWMLFGEKDSIWETYRTDKDEDEETNEDETEEEETSEDEETPEKEEKKSTQDLLSLFKKMNLNDLQGHLSQFSGVLASVQELLGQFKSDPPSSGSDTSEQQQSSPFSYRDD